MPNYARILMLSYIVHQCREKKTPFDDNDDNESLCENWPLENKVPMRSPYAFYPGVALR